MGRPRKRRREDLPPEEAQEGQLETIPTINGFTMPTFGDSDLVSHTELTASLPGFEGVPMDNAFSSSMIPPPYVEAFGEGPTCDST